jgi:hypothetical protein
VIQVTHIGRASVQTLSFLPVLLAFTDFGAFKDRQHATKWPTARPGQRGRTPSRRIYFVL